jgi:hypothetical protein
MNPIRLMVEVDKIKKDEMREVFEFLKGHDFWSKNIQSSDKLRKQFNQLHAQSKKNETGNYKGGKRGGLGQDFLEKHSRNIQSN